MNQIQRYIFYHVLRPTLVIVVGLAFLAILTQGLSHTDLIVENRQSALVYFKIVALGAPQIMALLTPMAIFVASIWTLNKLYRDSEIIAAHAAGLSRWQASVPVVCLAIISAIVHLGVNLWVQPTALRQMRAEVNTIRADLVSSLISPGQFVQPDNNLMVFAREQEGKDFLGVQIAVHPGTHDERYYLAERGRLVEIEGRPAIVMFNGEIHQSDANNALNILRFEQSTFDLSPFEKVKDALYLKASDRYLHELLTIDPNDAHEVRNEKVFLAEANARLVNPVISIVMALLAILTVCGGNFNRRGYTHRIVVSTSLALFLVIVQLTVHSASTRNTAMNYVQWFIPGLSIAILVYMLYWRGRHIKGTST